MRDYDALITALQHAQENDSESTRLTLISALTNSPWATAYTLGTGLHEAHVSGNWLPYLKRSLLLAEQAKKLAETRN